MNAMLEPRMLARSTQRSAPESEGERMAIEHSLPEANGKVVDWPDAAIAAFELARPVNPRGGGPGAGSYPGWLVHRSRLRSGAFVGPFRRGEGIGGAGSHR